MSIEQDNNRKLTSQDYGITDNSRLEQATRPSQIAPNDSGKPQDLNQLQMPKGPSLDQLRSEIAERTQSQKQVEVEQATRPSQLAPNDSGKPQDLNQLQMPKGPSLDQLRSEIAERTQSQKQVEVEQAQKQQNEISQKQSM